MLYAKHYLDPRSTKNRSKTLVSLTLRTLRGRVIPLTLFLPINK